MAYATARTLDGGVIFTADNAQQLADGVACHLRENRKPALGYTHVPSHAYPFTVWAIESETSISGDSYLTNSGVFDHWDRATGRTSQKGA